MHRRTSRVLRIERRHDLSDGHLRVVWNEPSWCPIRANGRTGLATYRFPLPAVRALRVTRALAPRSPAVSAEWTEDKVLAMSTERDPDGDTSTFHELKGRIKRFLGWMAADRRVEAEGEAEVRTGGNPSETTIKAVEHEVKQGYGETLDPPPHS